MRYFDELWYFVEAIVVVAIATSLVLGIMIGDIVRVFVVCFYRVLFKMWSCVTSLLCRVVSIVISQVSNWV